MGHSLLRSLVPLTHSLAPQCSLRLRTPLRSFVRSLAHSLTPELMGERFLDSSTHLYKRVCPSVHPSVRPLVRPSVRQSDRNSFFFQIRENTYFLIPRSLGGRGWQGKVGGGDDGARGGNEGCQGGREGVTKGADASEVWRVVYGMDASISYHLNPLCIRSTIRRPDGHTLL